MAKITSLLSFLLMFNIAYSQNLKYFLGFTNPKDKKVQVKFRLINNLIVIPVKINNSDTLHFILDSGLKTTIMTGFSGEINFYVAGKKTLNGLGENKGLEVIHTYRNKINIDDKILLTLQDIFLLKQDIFELSKKMGTEINGIIGSVLFDNFIVKINYDKKIITFYKKENFDSNKHKSWVKIPIEIYNSKPYVVLKIQKNQNEQFKAKFLIDLGASDILWLIPGTNKHISFDTAHTQYYIGEGLNGAIYGYYEKGDKLFFSPKIVAENFIITIPDTSYIHVPKNYDIKGRNGTLGSEILRRFNIIFDYRDRLIFIHKNSNFKDKFHIDLSGLVLETPIPDIPIYEVYQVQKNSPAEKAGILPGDQIIKINGIKAVDYDFNEIITMLRSRTGRKIRLILNRNGQTIKTVVVLHEYKLTN